MKSLRNSSFSRAAIRWGVVLLALAQNPLRGETPSDVARRTIPPGAALAQFARLLPDGGVSRGPVVTSGHVTNSALEDIVLVFAQDERLVLRVARPNGSVVADTPLPGHYVQWTRATEKGNGIALIQLAPDGGLSILIATADSASTGSWLNLLNFRNGALQSLTGPPLSTFGIELDCPSTGASCKVVNFGKWADLASARVEVYEWSGAGVARTDRDALRYELTRLAELARQASDAAPAMPYMRLFAAKLAVSKYIDLREFDLAAQVCADSLKRIETPSASLPVSSAVRLPPGETSEHLLATHIRNVRAETHKLLGKVFEASGRSDEAQREFAVAKSLREER